MAKQSRYKFPIMFQKLDDLDINDDRFTRVKIWMMHLGENFNGSIIDKEVVDDALPTLGYIPIVGFIEKNKSGEEDFSDHRYILTRKDGEITRTYIGHPYGCVLSSGDNDARYEERLCDDGITRTFLVVNGLIWNQFEDGAEIMNRDLIKSHSMELFDKDGYIDGYEDEDSLFHFTKITFQAACILGEDQEPGMQNSTIEVQFTMNDFVKNIQSELSNKLTAFTDYIKKQNNQKELKEGGQPMANPSDTKKDFSLTVMEQFSEISNIVSSYEKTKNYWGDEVQRYYAVDVQGDEVIVTDRGDNYNYYGFKFSVNEDKSVIDFATRCRKKTQYVDYVDGALYEGAFSFAKHIEEFEQTVTEKIDTLDSEKSGLETNYSVVKTELDKIKPEYENFVKKEKENEEKELSKRKDELFTKFDEHLSDNTEYLKIKKNKDELNLEDIEGQCALLFTKKSLSANFSKKAKDSSFAADVIDPIDDDGFIETKYGYIPVNK